MITIEIIFHFSYNVDYHENEFAIVPLLLNLYKTLIVLLLYYSIVVKVLPDIHQAFLLSLAGETKNRK